MSLRKIVIDIKNDEVFDRYVMDEVGHWDATSE
jgi:hypothetical protein